MTHILERPAREPDRVVRYSDRPTGVVDVFGGGNDVVMLIHGGFWRAAYDRTHLRPLAAALSKHGFLVALPEYRRVGDAGGGFPGTLDDIVALAGSIRDLVGAPDGSLQLVGHSAGGHLAMLAADARIRQVISLAGVLDLAAASGDRLSDGAADEFLGGAPIAAADPMTLPLPDCPIALLHGTGDEEVPLAYSQRFSARDARIRLQMPDCGHYELIDPEGPEFGQLAGLLTN